MPMNREFASFGDPGRFEIAVRWQKDSEPRSGLPADYGWSMGDLRLTVGGIILTANETGKRTQPFISWYLLPIAQWFADNWAVLLHEAEFPWHESSSAPAVAVVERKLLSLIDARDERGRRDYQNVQAWRNVHALNSASNGGLLPDLYLRRYLDTIEMSWTGRPPLFAPDQFRFSNGHGLAYLAVKDVALPLWQALEWIAASGKDIAQELSDQKSLSRLAARLDALQRETVIDLAAHRIGLRVAQLAFSAFKEKGLSDRFINDNEKIAGVPAVARFAPAVAMYGGLSPKLTQGDVIALSDVIAQAYHSDQEAAVLTALVSEESGPPLGAPHAEGYEWAYDLLEEDVTADVVSSYVDVESFLARLGVTILDMSLDTASIRGVALAGDGLSPTIMVNTTSVFNRTPSGRRFTLAHELGHLLYDRTLAKSVGISSGPWAPAGVEKRANAFAAMLLMPRQLVINAFEGGPKYNELSDIAAAAEKLHVGTSALIEHLFNLNLIDEGDREQLRTGLRVGP